MLKFDLIFLVIDIVILFHGQPQTNSLNNFVSISVVFVLTDARSTKRKTVVSDISRKYLIVELL